MDAGCIVVATDAGKIPMDVQDVRRMCKREERMLPVYRLNMIEFSILHEDSRLLLPSILHIIFVGEAVSFSPNLNSIYSPSSSRDSCSPLSLSLSLSLFSTSPACTQDVPLA